MSVAIDVPLSGSTAWLQARAAVLHITSSRDSIVDWDELQDAESFYWRLATGEALPGQPEPANNAPLLDL